LATIGVISSGSTVPGCSTAQFKVSRLGVPTLTLIALVSLPVVALGAEVENLLHPKGNKVQAKKEAKTRTLRPRSGGMQGIVPHRGSKEAE
jgi:hypothetical protein